MNIISTWIYLDLKGEESKYPQVGSDSSRQEFQDVYWRCVVLFFIRAKRFNPDCKLALFTNLGQANLPIVDGFSMQSKLEGLGVEIHTVLPDGLPPIDFYQGWRNQFYIFDILRFISNTTWENCENLLILDADCVWTQSGEPIWEQMKSFDWPTYVYNYPEDHLINGINRKDMQRLYEGYSNRKLVKVPNYSGGEIFASKLKLIPRIVAEFDILWKQLLKDHANRQPKFNEEAHALSYIHFLLNEEGEGKLNSAIKRMWTDGNVYRNIKPGDEKLPLWHLPAEKRLGFQKLFELTMNPRSRFHSLNPEKEKIFLAKIMGVTERKPSLVCRIASKMKRLVG